MNDDDFEDGTAADRRDAQRAHEAAGSLRPGIEPMQGWGEVDGAPLLIDMGGFISASTASTKPSPKIE